MKARIAIFFTGGTICMRIDPATGGAVPALSGEEIVAQVPGLTEVASLEVIDFARLPGPHVTPRKMLELARAVEQKLSDHDVAGAVVTHGTDTLEETAYLLDQTIDPAKPVVFVGAMRNSSEADWDGPRNLLSAARVAGATAARGMGVLVVMNDQILSAGEATKTHTEAVDTFQSRDFGPLGLVEKDRIVMARRPVRPAPLPIVPLGRDLEDRVELIALPAGADGGLIDFAVSQGAQGLVIEALGRGNVPLSAMPALERAMAKGIPAVITSRCRRGGVLDIYAYEGAGKQLTRSGAILGGLLPSHKARIKLMLLLSAGCNLEQIRSAFAV
jgi:L-asparaginase